MVSSYPSRYCGISEYTEGLVLALKRWGVRVETYRTYFRRDPFDFRTWIALFRLMIRSDYDVIHFQYTPTIVGPLAPLLLLTAKLFGEGAKVVVTSHEGPGTYKQHFGRILGWIFRLYEGAVYSLADLTFVHHETLGSDLLRAYPLRPEKLRTMPMGVNRPRVSSSRNIEDLETKYGVRGEGIILFFGLVAPRKGIETLLEGFSHFRSWGHGAQLVVAGKEAGEFPALRELRRIREAQEPGKDIVFTGALSDLEVEALLSISSIIVLPYSKATHSIVLAKAVEHGLPVIATDVGALGMTVREHGIGLVVPPKDPASLANRLRLIFEDKSLRKSIGDNLSRYRESFSWDRLVPAYLGAYSGRR